MPIVALHAAGAVLAVKVVPGASRDRIVGRLGERLKVSVRKPPEKGAANEAACSLVAAALGIRSRDVTVLRGETRPEKELLIQSLVPQEVVARLGLEISLLPPHGSSEPKK
jgi:uncharacterized protein